MLRKTVRLIFPFVVLTLAQAQSPSPSPLCPNRTSTHEPIRAPLHYWEASFPSLARNAYAQIQEWTDLYLHPGVDLFEEAYEEVYSVDDGVVRAILTTVGDEYWRTAIESFDTPGQGYLYAHLNEDSFVFSIGDTVAAGDVIGTLFPAYSFQPHLHFARIQPEGPEWNGDWWTLDNPLVDITNMTDSLAPVFEFASGSDPFAFRTRDGVYLDPLDLSGEVRIIAKCCDYAHSIAFGSRITPWDLKFKLYSIINPDSVIYEKYSFALDMPLDTYFSHSYETLVLNTIYSRDATCFSTNNNEARDFFFIITNSDGDSTITPEDSLEVFDTRDFPDGSYILEVVARDASLNSTSAYMVITIDNPPPAAPRPDISASPTQFSLCPNVPNPFNSATVIAFNLPVASHVNLDIYNLGGRKMLSLINGWMGAGPHRLAFDGANMASGAYIYRLTADNDFDSGQMILIK